MTDECKCDCHDPNKIGFFHCFGPMCCDGEEGGKAGKPLPRKAPLFSTINIRQPTDEDLKAIADVFKKDADPPITAAPQK